MKRFRDYRELAGADRGAAVAMGNFDGVHLGHQSVLALAHAAAAELGAPFGVITFEPHPRSFFAPSAPAFRLMTADARARRMQKLGVEVLYELPFGAALAGLSPEAFAADVLAEGLGVRHVVVGADFRFGKGRAGDAAGLKALGAAAGFAVTAAPLVSDGQGDFSSTAIRTALAEGQPEEAARILGHWHRIEGEVEHGEKRGRALGFPTANMGLAGLHLPRFGVYAVLVDVLSGPHQGPLSRGGLDRGAADLRRECRQPGGPSLRLRRRSLRRGAVGGAGGLSAAGAEVRRRGAAGGADAARRGGGARAARRHGVTGTCWKPSG